MYNIHKLVKIMYEGLFYEIKSNAKKSLFDVS